MTSHVLDKREYVILEKELGIHTRDLFYIYEDLNKQKKGPFKK